MSKLPNWVYDLVMDLQEQEATHPSLYRMGAGGEWVRWDWCPANALNKVPTEVQRAAEVIAEYRRQESPTSDSSAPAEVRLDLAPGDSEWVRRASAYLTARNVPLT